MIFTQRQLEVLREVAKGRSNREIAAVLGITRFGVNASLMRMSRKSDMDSRLGLVLLAISHGYITIDEIRNWYGVESPSAHRPTLRRAA